ncbi:MAG TPA: hypothetical protein VIM11_12870 [Tepidisphaeraceae bacterium]
MPEKKTIERATRDKREGKAPTTQAGEFVREEIHHVREGKHGARSTKQAIAIGLSKARRAGAEARFHWNIATTIFFNPGARNFLGLRWDIDAQAGRGVELPLVIWVPSAYVADVA